MTLEAHQPEIDLAHYDARLTELHKTFADGKKLLSDGTLITMLGIDWKGKHTSWVVTTKPQDLLGSFKYQTTLDRGIIQLGLPLLVLSGPGVSEDISTMTHVSLGNNGKKITGDMVEWTEACVREDRFIDFPYEIDNGRLKAQT